MRSRRRKDLSISREQQEFYLKMALASLKEAAAYLACAQVNRSYELSKLQSSVKGALYYNQHPEKWGRGPNTQPTNTGEANGEVEAAG